MQYSNFWFEFNFEHYGLNRRPREDFKSYVKRVKESDIFYRSHDNGIFDITPYRIKEINAKLKVHSKTFYFSLACSLRHKPFTKKRDIFKAPEMITKKGVGIDLNILQHIKMS
jgi:hypothetical protein